MGAVRMLAGFEIRRRWRSVVALTVLVGVVGAVVFATVAGARRSGSALARFDGFSRSAGAGLLPAPQGYTPTPAQLSDLGHVHDVVAVAVLRVYALVPQSASVSFRVTAPVDARFGSVVDRARIVSGRSANPAAVDEMTIGEVLAAQLHQGVGGHLDVLSYSPRQVEALARRGSGQRGTGRASAPAPAPAGPRVRLRIVGIVRRPLDLGVLGATGGIVVLTPAFDRAYFNRIGNFGVSLRVLKLHGASDLPAVVAAARRIFRTSGGLSFQADSTQGAQSAIDVLTLALWIFAGVAAVAGAVTIGIVVTREISLVSVDQATLRALGLTRPQRMLMSGPRALLIAAGGGLVAVFGAIAASPLLPIGVARRADPDPGLHLDWPVLALGAVAVAAVVVAIAFLAALRSNPRSAIEATHGTSRRPSGIVETAARVGLAPTTTSGLRMALQPGRGETAVPLRSAYLGAVLGVVGVIVVLVFAASLDHLVTTPRLYGWAWDVGAADTNYNPADVNACGRDDFGLGREPAVAAAAAVCDNVVQLGGRPVLGWGFTPLRGKIGPEVLAGRAPRTGHEVALGSVTLHALHKSIGDTVQGRGPHGTVEYQIVGRIVLPNPPRGQQGRRGAAGDPQLVADGAAFTNAGLSGIFDSNSNSNRYLLGRFAPGVDRAAVERRVAALPSLDKPAGPTVPAEVDRLRQINWLPATLGALLGSLALLAVGHALVTAVRRRRRDLALLKTLGFNRRQVRATVAWQATTLAAVGVVVGIPAGLAVGSVVWRLVANGLGVSPTTTIPTLAVLLTVPGVLALVNLIASFPARSAAQTRPAVALRSE